MTPLQEYINFYQKVESPEFAVLVSGEWGIGKTYQVKRCLKKFEPIYISLFGISNREQFLNEIVIKSLPFSENINTNLSSFVKNISQLSGIFKKFKNISYDLTSILRFTVAPNKILIFDDIERCSMPITEIFGVISEYVHDLKCHVIIIADESKLNTKEGYKDYKEKIIGHTIKILPEIENAFDVFSEKNSLHENNFLKLHKHNIIAIFEIERCKSLRILNSLVRELVRLIDCINVDELISQKNESAESYLLQVIRSFCIIHIKLAHGHLKFDDLYLDYELPREIFKISDTYDINIELQNKQLYEDALRFGLFDSQLLVDIFIHGKFNKNEIWKFVKNRVINSEPIYNEHWMYIYNFDRFNESILEEKKLMLMSQFENRELTESGNMLHMFALYFMMADLGIIDETIEDTQKKCEEYVNDLLWAGLLDDSDPKNGNTEVQFNAFGDEYGGFSFWVRDSYRTNFEEIKIYLSDMKMKAFYMDKLKLKKLIKNSLIGRIDEFYNLFCISEYGKNIYYRVPILHYINASEFTDLWFAKPKVEWLSVSRALDNRYKGNRLNGELSEEKEWAKKLLKELEMRAKNASGFQSISIIRVLPEELKKL